ncbi:substrate-binding domain-containing protein [Streptomyces sp. NPDC006289]|uniref:substrate-binding domain-containing protein n=1 Tax=Streptomyces sp. NPDC006289 TaxID=3156744 RepID=UPI0033A1F382
MDGLDRRVTGGAPDGSDRGVPPASEEPDRRRPTGARPTIGLVTANIHLGVGATLWSGALGAAERNDVNLVCFPGGPLRHGDVPRSALYELVGPARLDGIVCWSSTLGLPASGERAERLMRRLACLPAVSLNQPLSGLEETLSVDSYAGMREAVGHLVELHGHSRLACIRGPLANPVSQERYRAFTTALGRYRVAHDRSLTCAAVDFAAGAGASAMRVLVEARGFVPGVDFDAVIACSDVLAADALRFLTARGVRVPEEVAVIGFNDSPEALLSDPPLTSVALPFAELGALAVDSLVARLCGSHPPARTAVPGTLVVRRSCGCHSPLVSHGRTATGASGTSGLRPAASELFAPLPRAAPRLAAAFRADTALDPPVPVGPGPARAPADATRGTAASEEGPRGGPAAPASSAPSPVPAPYRATGSTDEALDEATAGEFLPLLESLLSSHVHTPRDVAAWDAALVRIRRPVLASLPLPCGELGELLFGRARLMVAEKAHRLLEYERWEQIRQSQRLRELGTALTAVVDVEGLTDVLERQTVTARMPGCRLVLYDEAGRRTDRTVPGLARVQLAQDERLARGRTGGTDTAYPAALLLPDALMPDARRFTLVLEPLHLGDDHLGFAVFDAGAVREAEHAGALFRALGDQISATLKGIRLFDEVRRARDAAEQASRFKTRLLDHVTHELRTPVESLLRHTGVQPREALTLVRRDATQLLSLIDNLLDLSRSEADDLDLTRRLQDPAPLLARAFLAASATRRAGPSWEITLPDRLPVVPVDGARLGRIITNLLSAAASHAGADGRVTLDAEAAPASVRTTVSSVRATVARARTVREPTVPPVTAADGAVQEDPRADHDGPGPDGADSDTARDPAGPAGPSSVGPRAAEIGLATAHRLAMLHGGSLTTDLGPGRLRLVLDLPLPTPGGGPPAASGRGETAVVVTPRCPVPELNGLVERHGLRLRRLAAGADIDSLVEELAPAAVAWDASGAGPEEWPGVQHLHDHPRLRHTPFLLYGAEGQDLSRTLRSLRPGTLRGPVIAATGSERSRKDCVRLMSAALPDHPLRIAPDGTTALALVAEEPPALVVVERTLPDMYAFDVIDHIHGAGPAPCPVVVLSDRGFGTADARRAKPHSTLLLDHAVLGPEGTTALLRMMTGRSPFPARSRAPVNTALVFLYEHYRHRVSRWQIAEAAGISADHLSRLFHQQYGLTVWDYLTRLRIQRAAERLLQSGDSIHAVARSVGFHDRSYFSRVFRKVTGEPPHVFRTQHPAEAGSATGKVPQ